jgi:hypothetical protein
MFVDRLPPGAKCVKDATDEASLVAFVEGIRRVQQTERHSVRARAVDAFATVHIAGQLIEALETARFRREPTVA